MTKEKNSGRVAAGKRLAEHNRIKRLKDKQDKEKTISETTDEEEENEVIEKEEVKERPTEYKTSNITLLLLVAAGGGLYFGNKNIPKMEKTSK